MGIPEAACRISLCQTLAKKQWGPGGQGRTLELCHQWAVGFLTLAHGYKQEQFGTVGSNCTVLSKCNMCTVLT